MSTVNIWEHCEHVMNIWSYCEHMVKYTYGHTYCEYMVYLGGPYHYITSNFLKAVFYKSSWSILEYRDPYIGLHEIQLHVFKIESNDIIETSN